MSSASVEPAQDSARDRFVERIVESLLSGSFVRLVLSAPGGASLPAQRLSGRLITVRGAPVLSVTVHEKTRDLTRNLPLDEVAAWLKATLMIEFRSGLLETITRDWQWSGRDNGSSRLAAHKPRVRVQPDRTHDRRKRHPLEGSSGDWMEALGLVDSTGRVLPAQAGKHQQITRYSDVLGHLVRDCQWAPGSPLRAVDMGCGLGYLTFAAWQLLRRQLGFQVEMTGIERRTELVRQAEDVARRFQLEGLHFQQGDISTAQTEKLDLLIALHACNTATDDSIRRGIESGARLIVLAPCCHQEIRPQLLAAAPFEAILAHGLFAERFAEWLTDGLRSMFLEWAGYRVKAIEFVAAEHTPKNLMLAAIQSGRPYSIPHLRDRIKEIKERFGIGPFSLDPLLDS